MLDYFVLIIGAFHQQKRHQPQRPAGSNRPHHRRRIHPPRQKRTIQTPATRTHPPA